MLQVLRVKDIRESVKYCEPEFSDTPIVVRRKRGRYKIVSGKARFAAAVLAGEDYVVVHGLKRDPRPSHYDNWFNARRRPKEPDWRREYEEYLAEEAVCKAEEARVRAEEELENILDHYFLSRELASGIEALGDSEDICQNEYLEELDRAYASIAYEN